MEVKKQKQLPGTMVASIFTSKFWVEHSHVYLNCHSVKKKKKKKNAKNAINITIVAYLGSRSRQLLF